MMQTLKLKKELFERINSLSTTEHSEILKIIQNRSVPISKNLNGVFFNLSTIPDNVVQEIAKFVEFCTKNAVDLDAYDKKIHECKLDNNFDRILNLNLENMVEENEQQKKRTVTWEDISLDQKQIHKIMTFIDKVVCDKEKSTKKKMSIKYTNARKRYSRKVFSEKKFENDIELESEKYFIT